MYDKPNLNGVIVQIGPDWVVLMTDDGRLHHVGLYEVLVLDTGRSVSTKEA